MKEKPTLLVIDDEPAVRETFKLWLEKEGYIVCTTAAKTVKAHIYHIFKKMAVKSRTQAIVKAVEAYYLNWENGILGLDNWGNGVLG